MTDDPKPPKGSRWAAFEAKMLALGPLPVSMLAFPIEPEPDERHIRDVPLDDIPRALSFYLYARDHGMPMGEVAHTLLMLQTTSEGSEELARAIEEENDRMPEPNKEGVQCIASPQGPHRSYCGRSTYREWVFVSLAHAEATVTSGSRLIPCAHCLQIAREETPA